MGELKRVDLERLSGERGPLGRTIDDDRACGECGYSLKGLRYGGTCPECGTPITISRKRREPEMGESPDLYLLQMSAGMALVGLGGFGWMFWLVMGPMLAQLGNVVIPFSPVLVLGLATAWTGGVLLILRERPFAKARRQESGGAPEWSTLRLIVAGTQGAALVGALAFALEAVTGWALWRVLLVASLGTMFAGWAPLCVYLSRIAYWAGDDDLGVRFHAMSYWVASLGLAVAFLFGPNVGIFVALRWVGVVALLFFLILSVIVMLAIMRMSTTVRWAERNAANVRARDRRMAERARREAEAAQAEREANLAAGGGTALSSEQEALLAEVERKHEEMMAREVAQPDHEPTGPLPGRQHIVESGDNVETFGLEDDDEPGRGRGGAI